jgi:hypothetical protein
MERSAAQTKVTQVTVSSHQVQRGKRHPDQSKRFVMYTLQVRGTTPYIHPMAKFDRNSCLPLDVPMYWVKIRYSSLLNMHKRLVVDFPMNKLPEFPPKRWMRNTSLHVIEDRKTRLNNYFSELLAVPKLCSAPNLIQVLCSPIFCKIAVVGCPRIGKASLVHAFALAQPMYRHSKVDLELNSSQLITTRGPIDLIVDNTLVRVERIETFTVHDRRDYTSLSSVLNGFEAVLVAFAPSQATTSEVADDLASLLEDKATSIVGLGSGDVALNEAQTADHQEEVYSVFELLVHKVLTAEHENAV